MSRINWIILALAVMLPGILGLGWGHLQERAETQRLDAAVMAVAEAPSADEYLAMYDAWSQLTPTEKAENPWGKGEYGGPEIQRRLRQDQPLRLEADLPDLEAGVKSYPSQLAEVLYGENWGDRLTEYQQRRETRGLVVMVSGIIMAAGGLLFTAGVIQFFVLRYLHKKTEIQGEETPTAGTVNKEVKQAEPVKPESSVSASGDSDSVEGGDDAVQDDDVDAAPDEDSDASGPKRAKSTGYFESVMSQQRRSEPGKSAYAASASKSSLPTATSLIEASRSTDKDSYFGWALDADTEDEPVTSLMTTQSPATGLSELTEEVSAIRQFAAAQQDQMRKLQDGYDWMIIRRFCMRIIRCIDNLEDRIARMGTEDEVLKSCLEDIRDELVFALESSGVEQYKPDINIPFKGLEKYAEAVRQRVPADDASLGGMIAEIVRPGYQYLISDDDVKIVRCAQVKLYDTAVTAA